MQKIGRRSFLALSGVAIAASRLGSAAVKKEANVRGGSVAGHVHTVH